MFHRATGVRFHQEGTMRHLITDRATGCIVRATYSTFVAARYAGHPDRYTVTTG